MHLYILVLAIVCNITGLDVQIVANRINAYLITLVIVIIAYCLVTAFELVTEFIKEITQIIVKNY